MQELSRLIQEVNEVIKNKLKQKTIIKEQIIPCPQPKYTMNSLEKKMSELSIFDKIPQIQIDFQLIEGKISNHKFQLIPQKRKDLLFNRFKKSQQQKIVHQKAEIEKKFIAHEPIFKITKGEFTLKNETLSKTQTFTINADDMDKLRPETDLNDVIVGSYIKLMQFAFLPIQIDQKTHIFSSFFLEKIICQLVKDEVTYDKDPFLLAELAKTKVDQNYKNVKRWTKSKDIFEKQILVFPINAFRHWFCIIVINPGFLLGAAEGAQIIYCDSMFERKQFVIQAIRRYLQHELKDKKGIINELTQRTIPCYQLLLPRQTNTHDCGLYMISYIEELLLHRNQLEHLEQISYRKKLDLIPRSLIYTMRERLRKLFVRLMNAKQQEKSQILAEYKGQKERIIKDASRADYDVINEKQYKKYEKMNLMNVIGASPQQRSYACEIRFYLDPEINFYEKDK